MKSDDNLTGPIIDIFEKNLSKLRSVEGSLQKREDSNRTQGMRANIPTSNNDFNILFNYTLEAEFDYLARVILLAQKNSSSFAQIYLSSFYLKWIRHLLLPRRGGTDFRRKLENVVGI